MSPLWKARTCPRTPKFAALQMLISGIAAARLAPACRVEDPVGVGELKRLPRRSLGEGGLKRLPRRSLGEGGLKR